ncbi:putative assembly protein [Vibrio alginolyticus]|uniref:Putative assembly protein n=3 Tax=Vibrio harveyi group TaxID=717610 RepID=A0A1W6UM59_VIBAL|nr:AsmA family protein [Vibrio alginolyticus]ARO99041.1 putative assembly protein [Vibrio alginolyticus]ARP03756.1 putative assembly protein [Vibrio alginolyticus]ARP08816.1 putative assembly protein [Vibrio alginolyticus]ARP13891.1 putative assembly protein [Vibrio alginolyticus]ARP18952.1 putative assembly protein [Vibrio alginolyticus]
MKKLLLILAIPIVVILVAILALTIFVNPNQFKPLIVEQAQKQTGLELVIEGDISWQFFPSIGFELGHTELRNPQGFSKPNLFKVDTVGVDISVMPLFSQQLEIGNVTLDGAEFYIETKKGGSKNIDALTKAQTQQAEQENNAAPTQNGETQTSGSDWSINLAGVTVSNGSLEMQDKQAGSYTKLYDISLNLSEFAFDNWTTADFGVKGEMNDQKFTAKGQADFKLEKGLANYALKNINFDATYSDPANKIESATIGLDTFEFDKVNNLTYAIKGDAGGMKLDMQGAGQLSVDKAISKVQLDKLTLKSTFEGDALPQSPMKVDMVSDLSFDLTKNHLSFVLEKLTANAIALDGKADVALGDIPKVRFALHSPNIDLDEFLGLDKQAAEGNKPASGGESAPAGPEVEPDLSALKTLDVKGDITIDKFKAANAKMEAVKTSFTVNRGVFELTSFSSKLYQGSISATAKLDARQSPATYSVKKSIKGVKVQPLLIDVAENDKLEGTGNIDVNVTGKSLTPTGIKKNLSGTVVINFADGAVNGINVAQLIRENYAKFKGQKVEGTNEAKKTDFSAMTATLKLNKGVVSTDNMQAQSPLLRVRGKGTANYINETVDFTISTSVVGSLEGQGGKDIDELKDITIPINVSGKWADPKFKLVFDDVLKQKAQKEIDRGVEKLTDKIKDEKTKDAVDGLLKNLFN